MYLRCKFFQICRAEQINNKIFLPIKYEVIDTCFTHYMILHINYEHALSPISEGAHVAIAKTYYERKLNVTKSMVTQYLKYLTVHHYAIAQLLLVIDREAKFIDYYVPGLQYLKKILPIVKSRIIEIHSKEVNK